LRIVLLTAVITVRHIPGMDAIRTYRIAHDLTQAQLGKLLGVRQTLISNIERGARGVSKAVALKLFQLDASHFPLEQLLSGDQLPAPVTPLSTTSAPASGHSKTEQKGAA
jgi:transcriptional regulator with XRE-family HTH domain